MTTTFSVLDNDLSQPFSDAIPPVSDDLFSSPGSSEHLEDEPSAAERVDVAPLPQQAQAAASAVASTVFVAPANSDSIDGLIEGRRWADVTVTYGFTSVFERDYVDYGVSSERYENHRDGFAVAPDSLQQVVRRWLSEMAGVSGLDFVELGAPEESSDDLAELGAPEDDSTELDGSENPLTAVRSATLRIALSNAPQVAYAYTPWPAEYGGDVWINNDTYGDWFVQAELGEYAYHTLGHELGHAVGLKHGHEGGGVNGSALPSALDSMEYTIMTYRSYENQIVDGAYKNAAGNYAQSLMLLDIQALQHLYGANFETLSEDTLYTFSPTTGEMFIDGVSQGQPVTNTIFRTLWDGNGNDTYDFSNYSTALKIDLNPGKHSDLDRFGNAQRALLGETESVYARGHVFNALRFEDDPRSLIENAIGGIGSDIIRGNLAANRLVGGAGNDWVNGAAGADQLVDGLGVDLMTGGDGPDVFVLSEDGDRDRITDFDIAEGDRLDLSAWGIIDLEQLDLVTTPQGAEIIFDDEVLALDNVAPSAFDYATIDGIPVDEPAPPDTNPTPVDPSGPTRISPLILPIEPSIEASPEVVSPLPLLPAPDLPLAEPLSTVVVPQPVVTSDDSASAVVSVPPPVTNSSISGQVRQDNDADGDLNDRDTGLGGVVLNLFNAQANGTQLVKGTLVSTTSTNQSGLYTFSNLAKGQYIIAEETPTGYVSTGDVDGSNPDQIVVSVGESSARVQQDFLDVLTPTESNHEWLGTQSADQFQGRARSEQAYGRGGDDVLLGEGSEDQLFGNDGDDLLKGGADNDILRGAEGNDMLLGGGEHDILHGTNARLRGIGEQDTLTGGAGEDTFVLGSASHVYYAAGGKRDHAWILDFTHGKDNLILHGSADHYRTTVQADGSMALVFRDPNRGADLVAYFADTAILDLSDSSIQYI